MQMCNNKTTKEQKWQVKLKKTAKNKRTVMKVWDSEEE